MREQNRTSSSAKSGIDVAKLAEAAATSYEMARRYAEGAAMPRPDKLAAIAKWLGVSVSTLAFGEDQPMASIDEKVLQQCIEAIQAAQARTGQTLTAENAAHLVAVLYREATTSRIPSQDSVDLLVKVSR